MRSMGVNHPHKHSAGIRVYQVVRVIIEIYVGVDEIARHRPRPTSNLTHNFAAIWVHCRIEQRFRGVILSWLALQVQKSRQKRGNYPRLHRVLRAIHPHNPHGLRCYISARPKLGVKKICSILYLYKVINLM